MADLLAGLNEGQRRAVSHGEGPLLVLAGPGSGKTRVITHRVAYLIQEHGVPSNRILAVTFTNKAADEMRRRIGDLVIGEIPLACTFHSFCARLLRRHAQRVGRTSRYSILDQQDRGRLVASIMKEMDLDTVHFPPDGVDRRISQLKNDLVLPEQFSERASDYFDQLVADIYPRYQERLAEQNAVDFDDLLSLTAQLLREDAEVRAQLDRQYRFVLVDEYQDTNLAQYAIARALSCDEPHLCVTGDPDQSIYGWRGANLGNILHFEDDFPGAQVVRLEQNYRSTRHILAVADYLIRHNTRRKHKELVTDNPSGSPVAVYCHKDDQAEANGVADAIRQAVDEGRRRYCDFAVFVRVMSVARAVESVFRARRIPYQTVGGFSFYERKEIRDVLAYLRLLLNPSDDSAFARIVNVPPRGIGATTVNRLSAHARRSGLSLLEAARRASEISTLRPKQRAALADFCSLLDNLAGAVDLPADLALHDIIEHTGYRAFVEQTDQQDDQQHQAILDDMVGQARNFVAERPNAELLDYLESVSLVSDADHRDDRSDLVTIMTLHAAKGLEFPVVFLIAFEHDILPHQRARNEGDEEEERRLAFVGITRAKEELSISYTRRRLYQGRLISAAPSSFLVELPEDNLQREDIATAWESTDDPDFSQDTGYEEPSIQIVRDAQGPSSTDQFCCGMLVEHPEYGQGLILQLEGIGESRRATIQFPTIGAKRFVLSKAPIQPVSKFV